MLRAYDVRGTVVAGGMRIQIAGGKQRVFKHLARCQVVSKFRPQPRDAIRQRVGAALAVLDNQHMEEKRGLRTAIKLTLARDAHHVRLLRGGRFDFDGTSGELKILMCTGWPLPTGHRPRAAQRRQQTFLQAMQFAPQPTLLLAVQALGTRGEKLLPACKLTEEDRDGLGRGGGGFDALSEVDGERVENISETRILECRANMRLARDSDGDRI